MSQGQQPKQVRFYLDEGLPHQVGKALQLVHFPITTAVDEKKRGWKDPPLIAWMAANDYTWITKDDSAKREHLDKLISSRINTVWIRGVDRIARRGGDSDKSGKRGDLEIHHMNRKPTDNRPENLKVLTKKGELHERADDR